MDVTYKIHQVNWLRNCHDKLILHHLCAMLTTSSVVEFWLCILWSLVRSRVGEIMVYTAKETKQGQKCCPLVLYVTCKCLPDFLFMVIKFTILKIDSTKIFKLKIKSFVRIFIIYIQFQNRKDLKLNYVLKMVSSYSNFYI